MAVLFGLIAIIWPDITVLALVFLWGAYAIVDGITAGWVGFQSGTSNRWLWILTGISGVLAGVISFAWPGVTAMVLLIFIAVWSIMVGVFQIVSAWQLRKEVEGEWLLALSGALFVLLGAFLLIRPGQGIAALTIALGIWALIWGVTLVALGLKARQLVPTR